MLADEIFLTGIIHPKVFGVELAVTIEAPADEPLSDGGLSPDVDPDLEVTISS